MSDFLTTRTKFFCTTGNTTLNGSEVAPRTIRFGRHADAASRVVFFVRETSAELRGKVFATEQTIRLDEMILY